MPTVYKFDQARNVLIMEDCGPEALTLKEFMRQGHVSSSAMADAIGGELGRFIGALHAWSRASPDGLLSVFAQNEQALRLSAWVTYGRVVQTLRPGAGDDVPHALTDPPLVVDEADLNVVRRVAAAMGGAMTAARDIVSLHS